MIFINEVGAMTPTQVFIAEHVVPITAMIFILAVLIGLTWLSIKDEN